MKNITAMIFGKIFSGCLGVGLELASWGCDLSLLCRNINQRPFEEPKLEVPTIYKAYVRAM